MEDWGLVAGEGGQIVCRILGSREIHVGFLGDSLSFIVFSLAILNASADVIFAEFYCQVLLDALLNFFRSGQFC